MKTKLTDSGHSMRLVMSNTLGDSMTVGVGYSGVRVSMKASNKPMLQAMQRLARTLVDWIETPGDDTYGQRLTKLNSLAQQCVAFDSLNTSLGGK